MTEQLPLTGLYRYPIKSCRGEPAKSIGTDGFGLEGDRRWMVVDSTGQFLTQRQLPRMALIQPKWQDDGISLSASGVDSLAVTTRGLSTTAKPVRVWHDEVNAVDVGDKAASWLARFLGATCRLVFMHESYRREVDPDWTSGPHETSFTDGFPFLLISEASLDDLNSRLDVPLPMNRFRPNLVVSGCEAFAEDSWRRIRIGVTEFSVAKPCARCAITTTDQSNGRRAGKEPLRTLATYRRLDGGSKVFFGQNLVHHHYHTTLEVGQTVEILE